MTTLTITHIASIPTASANVNLVATLQKWMARSAQRKELLALPDHLLEDIGITREQAIEEANKPFWK